MPRHRVQARLPRSVLSNSAKATTSERAGVARANTWYINTNNGNIHLLLERYLDRREYDECEKGLQLGFRLALRRLRELVANNFARRTV